MLMFPFFRYAPPACQVRERGGLAVWRLWGEGEAPASRGRASPSPHAPQPLPGALYPRGKDEVERPAWGQQSFGAFYHTAWFFAEKHGFSAWFWPGCAVLPPRISPLAKDAEAKRSHLAGGAAGSPVRAWQGRVLPLGLAHGEHERMQRRRDSVERGAS